MLPRMTRDRHHTFLVSAYLAGLLLAPAMACAEDSAPPVNECRWREKPIVIDGKPDEAAWQDAQWNSIFWDLGAGAPDPTQSKVALTWDDDGLYFAGVMQDRDLYARVTKHDGNTWDDDVFELFLMPGNVFVEAKKADKPYYEFEINPLNTTFDLLFDHTGDQKRDFLAGISRDVFQWKTAVQVMGTLNDGPAGDTSWSVEGFIPWSDLTKTGGKPLLGDTWRGLVARYDFPSSGKDPRISASAPMTKEKGFHDPGRWAHVYFCPPRSVP